VPLLFFVGAAILCPIALYFAARSPEAWGQQQGPLASVGVGVYRAAEASTWATVGAPLVVRVAAFTSLLLGQVLVPGVFAALAGLFIVVTRASTEGLSPLALVLLLSAPTGLLVSALLLAAGFALLRREPDAAPRARRAARAELLHHGALLVGVIVSVIAGDVGDRLPCSAIAVFAAASLGHGALLLRAVRSIAAAPAPDAPAT